MPISPVIEDLVRRLASAPGSGASLPWTRHGADAYALRGSVGQIMVWADKEDGNHPIHLGLYDSDDALVDEAITAVGEFYLPWERMLETVYTAARAAAHDIPGLVAQLADDFGLPAAPPSDDIPF